MALPLARPAVAAGVALVLMETLADFGVASYFGIQTFTTGIYKAWLSMDNAWRRPSWPPCCWWWCWPCCILEHRAQKRMRFAAGGVGRAGSSRGATAGAARWLARGGVAGVACRC